MVKEYLEKTRNKFLQEQTTLKKREVQLQNQLKEHISMIQLLEESNDPNYAAFTPREVHAYNEDKLEELRREQSLISDELTEVKRNILNVNCNIDEINSVIKVTDGLQDEHASASEKNKFYILETQEKERQRIARDLHDSTVQNLTSLVHKSELCINLMEMDQVRCKLELTSLNKYLRDVINDIRGMIYNLRPMSFDDIGFDVTVDRYLDKISQGATNFTYQVSGKPYLLNSVVALTLLRVIQEACSNAVKHGNAKNVKISLSYEEANVHLTIDDDGDGFDLSHVPDVSREDNSGFGLSMMRERVFLLSGDIQFVSKPEKGFHIDVNVPIKTMEENLC